MGFGFEKLTIELRGRAFNPGPSDKSFQLPKPHISKKSAQYARSHSSDWCVPGTAHVLKSDSTV